MINVPGQCFVLGPSSVAGLPAVANIEQLPNDCLLVVVPLAGEESLRLVQAVRHANLSVSVVGFARALCDQELEAAYTAGCDDVLLGEGDVQRFLARLSGSLVPRGLEWAPRVLQLLNELASRPDLQAVLNTVVVRMRSLFAVDRVSVVLFEQGADVGFVVVEAQNAALDNIVIRLDNYPELQRVIETGKPLLISDVSIDDMFANVRDKLNTAKERHKSTLLFPLVHKDNVVGALFLRSKTVVNVLDEMLQTFGQLIAAVTSVALGHALEQETLQSKQRALLRTKAQVDQEIAGLRQFSEFFERAQDGIVVVDQNGIMQYANIQAATSFGHSRAALAEQRLLDLLVPRCHNLAERVMRGDAVTDPSGYVDLVAANPSGKEVVISTAIRQLDDSGALFLSFRDVTELREIESELRQTKEFLENLIQSSVDAIIAADVDGRVMIFNRAAEQILGYAAREVIGKMNLAEIYPPGEFREVMQRCRADAYGGRGRLQSLRTELVARKGEQVPVNLSAAMIYEGQREIATVSIFADLRERRRMEEKLNQVQRQLQLSERQAVAIELAGAAAHELNQPLTSILGYAAMLSRRAPEDAMAKKAVGVILQETERMAGIVRRLGQIAAYSTKPYVGGSQILDLGSDEGFRQGPEPAKDSPEK